MREANHTGETTEVLFGRLSSARLPRKEQESVNYIEKLVKALEMIENEVHESGLTRVMASCIVESSGVIKLNVINTETLKMETIKFDDPDDFISGLDTAIEEHYEKH